MERRLRGARPQSPAGDRSRRSLLRLAGPGFAHRHRAAGILVPHRGNDLLVSWRQGQSAHERRRGHDHRHSSGARRGLSFRLRAPGCGTNRAIARGLGAVCFGRRRARACNSIRHLHRGAALREPVRRRGPGILFRRHDGGNHLRACQGSGFARGRPHFRIPVQGREQGYARGRPDAWRDASDRRLGAQGRRPRAHHGAAHSGRRWIARLDRQL